MTDMRQLYQEMILEHHRNPRNCGPLEGANRSADGDNPLCGDSLSVHMRVEDDVVKEISFEPHSGCSISRASGSIMTEVLKGKTREQADALFHAFRDMVTGKTVNLDEMGKLAVFGTVSEFPSRVKCAILAWHAAHAAMAGDDKPVTTE